MAKKEAHERILRTATELFYRHGFKRISIDEICSKAGISRKTFYVYFSNKNELAIEILRQIFESANDGFIAIMESNNSFSDKMNQYILFKLEATRSISMEFADDIFNSSVKEISDYYKSINEKGTEITRHYFKIAQDNNEIRKDLNLDVIMYFSDRLTDICNDPAFQSMFPGYKEMVTHAVKMFIFGIINHSSTDSF
ncbi:MAG: TetR/AcrR family transcriptional regulator [Bacteroidales bacterium]|jgi:AcrR family transcriptional regulator|nr:TetR/AcrR family transcriptional regulator [Bacteroidales bacterium]